MTLAGRLLSLLLGIAISGCTTYGKVVNDPKLTLTTEDTYSLTTAAKRVNEGEVTVAIAMSGGGTRAAALSYGVMKALKDTSLLQVDASKPVIDELDFISSVSGGSFTAAYYGLYGDKLFSDFEQDFLYHRVSDDLFTRLISPRTWFATGGRTQQAIDYYQANLFYGATFADLNRPNRPTVVINASDLGGGVRFSFLQEYFDLLCSDLSTYPIANAVTASSAVPLVFNPVVLRNHEGCEESQLIALSLGNEHKAHARRTLAALKSYQDKYDRTFIHLVDGGISDNLGLLSFYDVVESSGGGEAFFEQVGVRALPQFIMIVVDASTSPDYEMERSTQEPTINETVSAMTDIQLHRFNDTSKALFAKTMEQWASILSSEDVQVSTYFIDINLQDVTDIKKRHYLNQIPTDFSLEPEQVDALIEEGYQQLVTNDEFLSFLADFRTR
ncbi:patatin-like phospholipase family protein [Photobacterium sp. DA100]|uniref:patatin-like phospholipase family protein n=1 Tax=Photobacterium sp. DA100 TaxID=3027472 RepID=UPI002479B7F5|nr:patatin-like phospholipase family protein [Photobacterium sp. DA100]WEM40870.1 patatin-like phospholipase family protein [Photobacterium sp. DA100]